MTTKTAKTVAEIALETPRAAGVFQEFGIDYCCGGEMSLEEACHEARVPLPEVERALAEVREARVSAQTRDWRNESLARLIEHIVNFHHLYVRRALPRIEHLLAQVLTAHGQKHHDLAKVQRHFHVLADEMVRHMMKEEQVLFPYIIRMEVALAGGPAAQPPAFGTVRNPVRMMRSEHEATGVQLKEIRKITKDYDTPKEQCNSFRALYAALEEFEQERNQHIHLENNVLFPAAEALEDACRQAGRVTHEA